MAYIVTDTNKCRRIQVEISNKRKTIRLGKASKDDAERVLPHVKRLNCALITNNTPPNSLPQKTVQSHLAGRDEADVARRL